MRNRLVSITAFSILLTAGAPGCALLKKTPESDSAPAAIVVGENAVQGTAASAAAGEKPAAPGSPGVAQPGGAAAGSDVAELERSDLKGIKKVSIHLPYADVQLSGAADSPRKGHLKLSRVTGDPACRAHVRDEGGELVISDVPPTAGRVSAASKVRSAVPSASPCRFAIEIETREAWPATIDLTRGSVLAESWDEALSIKLEWGDVDVGSVGPLEVACGRCTLSGEGVGGPLHYTLESGNVGLAGLTGSVDGQTLGDTVLKWRKLKADSHVKLVSHAGDVILYFPDAQPLSIDLRAPRGDVSSRFESGGRGVPVTVMAELGNVQVYRVSGEARRAKSRKKGE